MNEFMITLKELNAVSVTLRLLLSIIFSGFIGWERQMQHHPTGLRTHILVCIGSTMTMMLGQYLYVEYGADPSRIGAQVVSGIGFLGVGTIISNRGFVRGITTAAGLWACACMGLALGAGFYMGASIGFLTVMFTLAGIRKFNNFYNKRHPRQKYIKICLKQLSDLAHATILLKKWGVIICNTQIGNIDNNNKGFIIVMELNMKNNIDSTMVLWDLLQESCILSAEYIHAADIADIHAGLQGDTDDESL